MKEPLCNAQEVERLASEVVGMITTCMEHLRSTTDFAPSTTSLTTTLPNLFASMIDGGLVLKIQETTDDVSRAIQMDDDEPVTVSVVLAAADERIKLVYEVLLPLLDALYRCYRVLDQLPTPLAPKNRQKPLPPPGMLSLQNYTDVAALLEFTVCTSILPLLEPHILVGVEERARFLLPKSIAGRLPRRSLLWGEQCVAQQSPSTAKALDELQRTVLVASKLLSLDRFRPMLLPRHVSDLYAAMFQAEHLQLELRRDVQTGMSRLQSQLLPSSNKAPSPIDSILQARALQTLLLQGRSCPAWLRARVSALLAALAETDLTSVVQVFVTSSKDPSAASLRLARAIIAGHNPRGAAASLVAMLDDMQGACGAIESLQASGLTTAQQANVYTAWALMDCLSLDVLFEVFLGTTKEWLTGDVLVSSTTLHLAIRRLGILCSCCPPFADCQKLCRLLLLPLTSENNSRKMNCLSMLLRTASLSSVLHSTAKQDALWTLRLVVRQLNSGLAKEGDIALLGRDVLAVALVYALAPSREDLNGFRLAEDGEVVVDGSKLYRMCYVQGDITESQRIDAVVEQIALRANVLAKDVLSPLFEKADEADKSGDQGSSELVASVFLLLLELYFAPAHEGVWRALVPSAMPVDGLDLVPMVSLPVVCEECPLEALLHSKDGAVTLFNLMRLVFQSAAAAVNADGNEFAVDSSQQAPSQYIASTEAFASLLGFANHIPSDEGSLGSSVGDRGEVICSLAAILLSLLVAILELGKGTRSNEEERLLSPFGPLLKAISSAALSVDASFCPPELSALASHAAALLVARRASAPLPAGEGARGPIDRLTRIEQDLQSVEPPIRARGVVQLRHLAHLVRDDLERTASTLDLTCEEGSANFSDWHILRLAMGALSDEESYVYLAAVQTIATIAETSSEMLVAIALAISSGELVCGDRTRCDVSAEQRAKLTEAFIAIIRRKAAINECIADLFDAVIYGGRSSASAGTATSNQGKDIQRETHEYFLHGTAGADASDELMTKVEKWGEIDRRVAVGGPLFASEESDLARASCITAAAVLTAASDVVIASRYCPVLVQCATSAIRLDTSRPVRRCGAGLARSLFEALLREQHSLLTQEEDPHGVPFAMAMIAGGVDALCAALKRCVTAADLADSTSERYYDPATVARCEEALTLYQEAVEGGILAAGRVMCDAKAKDDAHPILRTLREPSRSRGHASSRNILSKSLIEEL